MRLFVTFSLLSTFILCASSDIIEFENEPLQPLKDYEEDFAPEYYDVPVFNNAVLKSIMDLIAYYGPELVTLPYRVQVGQEVTGDVVTRVYKLYYFNIFGVGPKVEMCQGIVSYKDDTPFATPQVRELFCDPFVFPVDKYFAGRSKLSKKGPFNPNMF